MQLPSRQEIRVRNLFNVVDCKLHWQKNGDYLCVKVDRTPKGTQVCVDSDCINKFWFCLMPTSCFLAVLSFNIDGVNCIMPKLFFHLNLRHVKSKVYIKFTCKICFAFSGILDWSGIPHLFLLAAKQLLNNPRSCCTMCHKFICLDWVSFSVWKETNAFVRFLGYSLS